MVLVAKTRPFRTSWGLRLGEQAPPFSTNGFQGGGEDGGRVRDEESNRRNEPSEPQDPYSQMAQTLRDKFILSADGKRFLPLDQLEAIVNETAVQNLLDRIFTTRPPSAQDICPRPEFQDSENNIADISRRKIFATLVLISKVGLIRDFITEGITDADLPLERRRTASETFLVPRDVKSDPSPNYALKQTPWGWTCNDIALFCNEQWAISAPYFSRAEDLGKKVHLYSLSPHDILPFVKPGTDDRGNPASLNQGFFSTVRRVKIHNAHHNFLVKAGHDGADFAVKMITRVHDVSAKSHKECFELEVEALKRFCQKDETHIIKLLATYEIGGVYHLLFPVADGNLMDLWKKPLQDMRPPAYLPGAALWLARECLGIAQALGKIHRFTYTPPLGTSMRPSQMPIHGIHGDIKPQNVLWFKELPSHLQGSSDNSARPAGSNDLNLGHLQLSDFGTVYFHREKSRIRNIMPVEGVTYRAPETNLPDPQGSPALDIWAFGCLYVDMITWFLCGYVAVDEDFPFARTQDEPEPGEDGLPRQDKFFISSRSWFKRGEIQVVKPSVTEWIESLHKNPRCSQFLHDFLDFIEVHMLVVSPNDRVECTKVVQELLRLKVKCDQTSAYHEAGKPRVWTSFIFNYLLGNRQVQSVDITTEAKWKEWFDDEKGILLTSKPTTSVILGSRSKESLEGLDYLPFSRSIFEYILQRFSIHDSVARTIFRNYTATFSRAYLVSEGAAGNAIVYNCRSSAQWGNDLALSATYFPDTGSIFAIFYGCNDHSIGKTIMTKIANRISKSSEDAFSHPMFLVGVFAEIERARMRELVLTAKLSLQNVINALQINGYKSISHSTSPADPWLNVYEIRNGLEFWAKLLMNMISHIEELDRDQHHRHQSELFRRTGRRIKDRLEELHLEYEGLVKDCDRIVDGMTLATSLALARDNMNDGKQMKAIALLTMIFLPATFVATFFSMTLVELGPSYGWLYPSVTIPLTITVLSAYWVAVVKPWKKQDLDPADAYKSDEKSRYCCLV
ncbi:hypothetical protein GQX73_g8948 [Xylaria multiplex]|uniref:Protein kinase domain-containing protein n=1 Tax=Xylaria multiplex TaxID=323545 RepID=A0A7C8MHB9_9PEZI|nr:hypothetical protein GQX73_g8948 [Xylaria multiplex]